MAAQIFTRQSVLVGMLAAAAALSGCSRESGTVRSETTHAIRDDALFPRRLAGQGGAVVMHAPQIDSWTEHRKMSARMALEVKLATGPSTLIGTGQFSAATETDLESRIVTIYDVEADRFSFPGASAAEAEQAGALVRTLMKKQPQRIPLDLFLSYLTDTLASAHAALRMDPPPIFVSQVPAILVIVNGKPALLSVSGSAARVAVNTNWDLFRVDDAWYLRNQDQWLTASELDSTWAATAALPRALQQLPDDENWRETRARIPPPQTSQPVPKVLISEQPAELILIAGQPALEPIGASSLAYVKNTESDLFRIDARYYYLASGRWFTASRLQGPWHAVAKLPAAFASIPRDHAKAHVRVSVAGTEEALRAVQEAAIPRTAVLARSAQPAIDVYYDGVSQFEPISGTSLSRASNSPQDVVTDGQHYYLCYDAVWYVAVTANGPWSIATAVPPAVYSIPPSSPVHHVTHVKVYESTPTTVTTGYTGGYYGAYSTGTTVVYGTGYPYPYYLRYAGMYPVYFWYPYSYGYGSWYNPNNGAFGEAAAIYGPYGGAGRTAAYNPQTGTYRRGYAMWDDDEIAGTVRAYNPRTGTGALTNRYATEDKAWGETLIARGDEWVYSRSERDGNVTRTELETSRGGSGEITTVREGDAATRSGELSRGEHSISTSGQRAGNEYSGTIETSRARAEIDRSYADGELTREAEIVRDDGKTGTISGTTTRGSDGLTTEFETSGGGQGTVSREVENGTVQRSGEITRGDQTIDTEMVRGDGGTVRRIESGGESAAIARGEGGDLYAAKDGEVYRRTDGGWEQHDGSGWSKSSQPEATPTSSRDAQVRLGELDHDRAARQRGIEQYQVRRQQSVQRSRGAGARRRR